MSELIWEEIENQEVWDSSLSQTAGASFLQSFEFGQFQEKLGNKVFRLGLKKDGKISSFCQIIKLKTRFGEFFYVPSGPIIDNWGEDLSPLVNSIKSIAKAEKVSFTYLIDFL